MHEGHVYYRSMTELLEDEWPPLVAVGHLVGGVQERTQYRWGVSEGPLLTGSGSLGFLSPHDSL